LGHSLGFEAAVGQFLNPEGKDGKHQFPAKTRRCWPAETLVPQI
jgi:hypothetical protein